MQSIAICRLPISRLSPLPARFTSTFSFTSLARFMPDHPILPLVAAAKSHLLPDLRTLHAHTITSGLIGDTFAASRLVQLFLRPGPHADLRYADAIFRSLDSPDVYTWNAMIVGHTDHGSLASAVACYFHMRANLAPPNAYTFALLVKACINGDEGLIRLGREVHGQVIKCGAEDFVVVKNSLLSMYCNMGFLEDARQLFDRSLHLDLISWNTLISAYGKNRDVTTARYLFERMPQRSLVSWSAMIDGYVRSEDFLDALRLFNEMQIEKIKPDAVTLVSVLKACAQLGALDQGRWFHLYIDRNGFRKDDNVVLETALVDMYSKCGCIDEARKVFDSVHNGDVVLWNVMIIGLGMHGHGSAALDLFEKMKQIGMSPNEMTLICILCACSHSGMVEEGKQIFESMKEYGIQPQREHYGCLADLLGRAGQVEEAEQVLLNMPMEPHASQWGALMSACRLHNKIEVGEQVGKHLIAVEPQDGGRYVLMANMYALNGRWDEARHIRKAMEEEGAKKETGCSFIEWNGTVHEFIVGDMSHPLSREIYAFLAEMERKLQMVGYVRDSSQVLVDVDDEEEKGMALSYHSEKLALAFGIMNIASGVPIRIVKNLRVCKDCHTHAKLVSRLYRREIIVRDRHRFHRFKEGSCSCNDYW